MKFVDSASIDDNTYGDGTKPPSTWLTPDVLPEAPAPHQAENSQTGASSNSSHKSSAHKTIKQEKNLIFLSTHVEVGHDELQSPKYLSAAKELTTITHINTNIMSALEEFYHSVQSY